MASPWCLPACSYWGEEPWFGWASSSWVPAPTSWAARHAQQLPPDRHHLHLLARTAGHGDDEGKSWSVSHERELGREGRGYRNTKVIDRSQTIWMPTSQIHLTLTPPRKKFFWDVTSHTYNKSKSNISNSPSAFQMLRVRAIERRGVKGQKVMNVL